VYDFEILIDKDHRQQEIITKLFNFIKLLDENSSNFIQDRENIYNSNYKIVFR